MTIGEEGDEEGGAAPVELRAVRFGYGARPVLREVSLRVAAGEFLAIVGPNGCGKSTALKLMAGLLRPSAGDALILGRPVGGYSRRELACRVAMLTQAGAVPPNLRVQDLVAMGRFAHQTLLRRRSAEDETRVAEALRAMEVQDLAGRQVGELSGGQLQRCRMAMTLAQGGAVLLLDEPTTYLDLKHQFGILETARAQARAGRAVVAVLHDFSQASLYADRIALMHEGRLFRDGPAAEVLTSDTVAAVFGVRTETVRVGRAVLHLPEGHGGWEPRP